MARFSESRVTSGRSPTRTSAPSRAATDVPHLRLADAARCPFVLARRTRRSDAPERRDMSSEKINFTSRGIRGRPRICVPVQATGKSRQASPRARPANGPVAKRHASPVSQTSPMGSPAPGGSGKRGRRRARAPDARNKNGLELLAQTDVPARERRNILRHEAAASAAKKCLKRFRPSSIRSIDVA